MTRLADLIEIFYDHVSLGDSTAASALLVDTLATENLVMVASTPRDVATYGRPKLDAFDPDLTSAERSRIAGVDDPFATGYGTLAFVGSALRCGVVEEATRTKARLTYIEQRAMPQPLRDRASYLADVDRAIAAVSTL